LAKYPELKKQLIETGKDFIVEDCTKRKKSSGLLWEPPLKMENGLSKLVRKNYGWNSECRLKVYDKTNNSSNQNNIYHRQT
jgi:hypothetical protein